MLAMAALIVVGVTIIVCIVAFAAMLLAVEEAEQEAARKAERHNSWDFMESPEISSKRTCPRCSGRGSLDDLIYTAVGTILECPYTCPKCGGSGNITKD